MKTVELKGSGGSNPSSSAQKLAFASFFASEEGLEAHVTLSPNPSPRERGWRQKPPFVASLLIAPPQGGEGCRRRRKPGRKRDKSCPRYPIPNPFPRGRGLSRFAPTLIKAPPQAGRDVAVGEIPEEEGSFRAIEIDLLILNQIRHRLPVFHGGFPARRPLQYAHKFFRKLFVC